MSPHVHRPIFQSGCASDQRLDAMIEMATQIICDPAQRLDSLPHLLATRWPEARALDVSVALAFSADAVQALFGEDGDSGRRAQAVWRHAAIVAVDLRQMTQGETSERTAADLLAFWGTGDMPDGRS